MSLPETLFPPPSTAVRALILVTKMLRLFIPCPQYPLLIYGRSVFVCRQVHERGEDVTKAQGFIAEAVRCGHSPHTLGSSSFLLQAA